MNTDVEVVSRRRLVRTAVITTVLATGHFADHVIRGELVVDRGLNPEWNHSGWPFQPEVNPFDLSVILVYLIPLNPTPGSKWDASPKPVEREFVRRVNVAGVPCTVRDTRGQEIAAACGQLAAQDPAARPSVQVPG